MFFRLNSLVTSRGWSFRNWLFRFVSSLDSTALWHWLKFGKIPTKQNWSTSGTSLIQKVKLLTGDFIRRIIIFKRRRCLNYNAIVLPTPNPVHPSHDVWCAKFWTHLQYCYSWWGEWQWRWWWKKEVKNEIEIGGFST